MDALDYISVRFHFGGSFVSSDGYIQYVDGRIGMSSIEIDKISLPEIKGHLADHVVPTDVMRMHWFRHVSGLILLVDDKSCQLMADHVTHGGVADVYVEDVCVVSNAANQLPDVEAEHERSSQIRKDEDNSWEDVKGKGVAILDEEEGTDSDTSDDEYLQPIEEDSSEEEDEAQEMRNFAKEVKRNIKGKKLGFNGSQLGKFSEEALFAEGCMLEDEAEQAEPFVDSSDEYSYGDDSDGKTKRWKSTENRYDSKSVVPVFSLGMAFRCKRQFKKALIKYGITTHRHILFPKDEKNRVKAICSWPGCKWLIYGSKISRSEWFKVVTFVDDHCCPPRKDNKLVTSPLIAKRYYNEIKDNPTWKVELIKRAVLKDMLADVSIAKCKRAKALVLKAALDSMKGEYSKVYDYQMELLRSNPGTTVVVCLNPEIKDQHVYERFYVCFDACKKGFLTSCRRVIGLDGCWFKGATNGQLLCAIGRDANNQMYPIA